jgi:hypothetical protein
MRDLTFTKDNSMKYLRKKTLIAAFCVVGVCVVCSCQQKGSAPGLSNPIISDQVSAQTNSLAKVRRDREETSNYYVLLSAAYTSINHRGSRNDPLSWTDMNAGIAAAPGNSINNFYIQSDTDFSVNDNWYIYNANDSVTINLLSVSEPWRLAAYGVIFGQDGNDIESGKDFTVNIKGLVTVCAQMLFGSYSGETPQHYNFYTCHIEADNGLMLDNDFYQDNLTRASVRFYGCTILFVGAQTSRNNQILFQDCIAWCAGIPVTADGDIAPVLRIKNCVFANPADMIPGSLCNNTQWDWVPSDTWPPYLSADRAAFNSNLLTGILTPPQPGTPPYKSVDKTAGQKESFSYNTGLWGTPRVGIGAVDFAAGKPDPKTFKPIKSHFRAQLKKRFQH